MPSPVGTAASMKAALTRKPSGMWSSTASPLASRARQHTGNQYRDLLAMCEDDLPDLFVTITEDESTCPAALAVQQIVTTVLPMARGAMRLWSAHA